MRLLATGVDTLNLSVRGTVRESVWDLLAEVQGRARLNEFLEPFSFPTTEEAFGCRPYGWRGYTYWLSSPDFELMLGRSAKFPAVLVQLHSAFLHSMGIDPALDQVERLLRLDVVAGAFKESVSRIDLHADVQGWELRTADLDRFIGYGRHRRAFEDNRQVFKSGSKLSGFMFGKDALVGRIYDKTAQIRKDGISWLPDLWGRTSTRPRRSGGWNSSSGVRRWPTSRPSRLMRSSRPCRTSGTTGRLSGSRSGSPSVTSGGAVGRSTRRGRRSERFASLRR